MQRTSRGAWRKRERDKEKRGVDTEIGSSYRVTQISAGPPRSRQETPKRPPRDPKGSQKSPKTVSKPSLDLNRSSFTHVNISNGKSRFLRVGGSVWDFKIDPKRPRQKIKDDIAESRTKMNKKKQPEASKRRQREFQEGSRSVKKDVGRVARRNARGHRGGL